MAGGMNGLSSFSSGGGGGWTTIPAPRALKVNVTKPSHPDHGFIHNLLTDIRNSAVGLPMGFVDLGKGLGAASTGNFKPLEKIGGNVAHSYQDMYGPAFHGHFGLTLHRMGQHPLQPILDAVSLITLPLGGLGAGIKGADVLSQLGERAGVVSSARAMQLERAANHFRARSTVLAAKNDRPVAYQHWSGNPTSRYFQGLSRGTQSLLAAKAPTIFGDKGMLFDLTPGAKQDRYLSRQRSAREHASSAQMARELHAVKDLIKTGADPTTIANALAPHIDDIFHTHAMPVHTSHISNKSRTPLAEGWTFLAKHPKYHPYPEGSTVTDFGEWINKYTARMTTPIRNRALKDEHGNLYVVRQRMGRELADEAARTHKALKLLYDNPTKVWKWMVLATAPRYFVNNVIGNSLMVAMAANPVATSRAMGQTIRQLHGERAYRRSLDAVGRAQRKITGDAIDKYYAATTEGFGHEVTRDLQLHEKIKNPVLRRGIKTAEGGLFEITHKASDTIPRRMLINLYSKRTPEYQAYYRAAGRSGQSHMAAHEGAIAHSATNPATRDWVTEQVNNVLGQYHHFNRVEKGVKRVIPFYSWDRAIMRHAWHMAAERPVEAQALSQIGQQGTEHTQKVLGHIPDFMKGVIPMSQMGILDNILGHHHKGRTNVLSTQGMNPYATVPDVADFVATLVHGNPRAGETLAAQANPLITGGIEHYTGQSLLSGKKLPTHGGLLQDIGANVATSTPWVKAAGVVINGRPHPKVDARTGLPKSSLLYRGDATQQGLSLLGVPIKETNLATAGKLYNQEHGIKTPHYAKQKMDGLHAFKTVIHAPRKPRRPRKPRPHLSHHGARPHTNRFLHMKRVI